MTSWDETGLHNLWRIYYCRWTSMPIATNLKSP